MHFPSPEKQIPTLTTEQMIEVDRAMIEDFNIDLIQMMENAGRNLAHLARIRFLGGAPEGKKIFVLAGIGGNGGGALVSARRLFNYGAQVVVITTKPQDKFAPIPAKQHIIISRMGIPVLLPDEIDQNNHPDLIIDGIIGYSLSGAPRGNAKKLIEWANSQAAPILALDAPSGVDVTTGKAFDPAIIAAATMTLALPKKGLCSPDVKANIGELYLADIGVPPTLYRGNPFLPEVDNIFSKGDILRLKF